MILNARDKMTRCLLPVAKLLATVAARKPFGESRLKA